VPAGHDERIRLVQSARQEAAIAMYERALKAKGAQDEIVTPHSLDEGDWVLVRHEKPQKFETKWFGPYQIVHTAYVASYITSTRPGWKGTSSTSAWQSADQSEYSYDR